MEKKQTNKAPVQKKQKPGNEQSIGQHLLAAVTHNWKWKLMALVLAVALWAGLIAQDPTILRDIVFTNIPVTAKDINSYDVRINKGVVVTHDFAAEPFYVQVRAEVGQLNYVNYKSSDVTVTVDPASIKSDMRGLSTVKLRATLNGAQNITVTPDTIQVEIDGYLSKRSMPVEAKLVGARRDDYEVTLTPATTRVDVSGPYKEVYDLLKLAVVEIDASSIVYEEGERDISVPIKLMAYKDEAERTDENDLYEELKSDLISITSGDADSRFIFVRVKVSPKKTVVIDKSLPVYTGELPDGYRIEEVRYDTEAITAYGESTALERFSISYKNHFDLSTVDGYGSYPFDVEIVGDSALVLSTSNIKGTLVIGPIIPDPPMEYTNVTIEIRNPPLGYTVQIEPAKVTLWISGPKLMMDKLRKNQVTAYVDLADFDVTADTAVGVQVDVADLLPENIPYVNVTPSTEEVAVTLKEK